MTYLKWTLRLIVLLVVGGFLHYSLPVWDTVRITGTEIKREDIAYPIFWSRADSGQTLSESRDVRFINTQKPDGSPIVYRNEDTGFSWPPFFKVNSADVQATAQGLISARSDATPQWVAIKHYGWRNTWLSAYPNALRMKEVEGPNASVTPWTSIVILVLLLLILWSLYVRWRRFWAKRIDPVVEGVVDDWEAVDDDIDGKRNIFSHSWRWITGQRG